MKYFPKASKKSMCVSHVQNSSLIFLDFSHFLIWSLLFWICFFLTLLRSCPYCFYSICHLWVFSSRTHSSVRRLSMTFPNLQTCLKDRKVTLITACSSSYLALQYCVVRRSTDTCRAGSDRGCGLMREFPCAGGCTGGSGSVCICRAVQGTTQLGLWTLKENNAEGCLWTRLCLVLALNMKD